MSRAVCSARHRRPKNTRDNQTSSPSSQRQKLSASELLDKRKSLSEVEHCIFVSPPYPCAALIACFDSQQLPHAWESNDSLRSLTSRWQKQHECIKAKDWSGGCRRAPKKSCHAQGFCTCCRNPQGRWIRSVDARVAEFIKRVTKDELLHQALLGGMLVLHWQGRQLQLANSGATSGPSSSSASVEGRLSEASVAPAPASDFFTHIPLHYQNPWRPTLLGMRHVSESQIPDIPEPAASVMQDLRYHEFVPICTITNEMQFYSLPMFIATLDPMFTWHCALWKLSERSVPCHLVGSVFAHPLPLGACACLGCYSSSEHKEDTPGSTTACSCG